MKINTKWTKASLMISVSDSVFDIKFYMFTIILFLFNGLSIYSQLVGCVIGVCSIIFLAYLFTKKGVGDYLLGFLVFSTMSLENSIYFMGSNSFSLYNFLNLPIIGGYHIYLLILIPFLAFFREKGLCGFWTKRNKNVRNFIVILWILFALGFLSSAVCYIIDGNLVEDSKAFTTFFRRDFLRMSSLTFMGTYIFENLMNDRIFEKRLEKTLYLLLISVMPAAVLQICLGILGKYGEQKVFAIGYIIFFEVLLTVSFFYKDMRNRGWNVFLGFLSLLLTLKYPSIFGGKWWLLVISIPALIVLLYANLSRIQKLGIVLLAFVCVIVSAVLLGYLAEYMNWFSMHKLEDALKTVMFWKKDWYMHIPTSPQYRIDEFWNIWEGLKENIYYLLFGKGYGGYIQKTVGASDWTMAYSFMPVEIKEQLYFNMHESINILFLKYGLLGVAFFSYFVLKGIVYLKNNFWLVIGLFWLIFFFWTYQSLWFGFACFLLGLYKIENKGVL